MWKRTLIILILYATISFTLIMAPLSRLQVKGKGRMVVSQARTVSTCPCTPSNSQTRHRGNVVSHTLRTRTPTTALNSRIAQLKPLLPLRTLMQCRGGWKTNGRTFHRGLGNNYLLGCKIPLSIKSRVPSIQLARIPSLTYE